MRFKLFKVSVKISFLLIVMLTLFVFIDENKTAFFGFLAALLHELGHIFAAEFLGCEIRELAFMPFGIRMKLKKGLETLSKKKKIIVLFSGCAVNFLCCFLLFIINNRLTVIATLHLIIAVFNLLPVGTLDGGRILFEIVLIKFPFNRAQIICDFVSFLIAGFLFILGAIMLIKTGYNFSLVVTAIYLIFMLIIRQKKLN